MNTKQFATIFLTILMATLFMGAAAAIENPVLKTTLLRYDPTPAQPGEYITAYVQIENIGDKSAKNARIEFIDNFPFSMDDEQNKIEDIGLIVTGQTVINKFKIRVDSDAIEGENELKFQISDDYPADIYIEKIFNVNVLTQDADVDITEIDVSPDDVNPGERANIKITLKNTADSTLKDVSLTLSTVTIAGTTVTDLPFAIEDSISKKTAEALKSKESIVFEYPIISYPTVASGIYKLPILLEFYDGTGTKYNKTDFITLIVNPKVEVYIIVERSDLTRESRKGDVVIRVVNKGFGELKFANLKIGSSDDFELVSPFDQEYIGNIDSDDYETAEFEIIAKSDELNIPITLEFKDALNKAYTQSQDITLKLYSVNGRKTGASTYILILAVLAVAVYWFYRRRKKRK